MDPTEGQNEIKPKISFKPKTQNNKLLWSKLPYLLLTILNICWIFGLLNFTYKFGENTGLQGRKSEMDVPVPV